jgi:opacity protein-like surface antigen
MIRPVILAAILAISNVGIVYAADLGPPAPPVSMPQEDNMALFGSGWYIRGDLGYTVWQGPSGSYNGTPFSHLSVTDFPTLGGGVGYKINNWVRADVTADYQFSGSVHASYFDAAGDLFTDKTRLGGWTLLANGYVDLGTWSRVTPYLGAGVGYAFTEVSKIINQEFIPIGGGNFAAVTDPTTGLPVFNAYLTNTTGGFAWALMAGASVDVAPSLKVDIGYRYLNVADARMATDNFGVAPKLKSLGAHQFRIGVRYMFDE